MDAEPQSAATPPDPESTPIGPTPTVPTPQRLFLHEPGWGVALKLGSVRQFCYMIAPGQDYYHRLLDGELYLFHGDERLCFACAERRGLLSFEPKSLRQPLLTFEIDLEVKGPDSEFDLRGSRDDKFE